MHTSLLPLWSKYILAHPSQPDRAHNTAAVPKGTARQVPHAGMLEDIFTRSLHSLLSSFPNPISSSPSTPLNQPEHTRTLLLWTPYWSQPQLKRKGWSWGTKHSGLRQTAQESLQALCCHGQHQQPGPIGAHHSSLPPRPTGLFNFSPSSLLAYRIVQEAINPAEFGYMGWKLNGRSGKAEGERAATPAGQLGHADTCSILSRQQRLSKEGMFVCIPATIRNFCPQIWKLANLNLPECIWDSLYLPPFHPLVKAFPHL